MFLENPADRILSDQDVVLLSHAESGDYEPGEPGVELRQLRHFVSVATSTLTLDPNWLPIRKAGAIAVSAEETARAICPPDLAVVPICPPPRSAIAVAWRQGDRTALLDRFLGFVRAYRDAHGWAADNLRLSPVGKHLLDGPGSARFP
jgi:hypothetical protein